MLTVTLPYSWGGRDKALAEQAKASAASGIEQAKETTREVAAKVKEETKKVVDRVSK